MDKEEELKNDTDSVGDTAESSSELSAVDSADFEGAVDTVVPADELSGDGESGRSPFESLSDAAEQAASGIESLIDEHEEEVSENGTTVRARGVFLLPNLFTTGALFCGFYAVVAAMRGDYETAPIVVA